MVNTSLKKLSLLEIISIAVGTMIGASIFSIFGLGAKLAGSNLPEAFLLSGFFALIVAYSYSKLSSKIVSNAGPIAFILKGLGNNLFTRSLSVLMWLTYVVSISLFAKGFTGYFLPLLGIPITYLSESLTIILLVSVFTALNFFGSKAVGKAEFYIVLTKLSILGVFVLFGVLKIRGVNLLPQTDISHIQGLLNASVIFFLSYMGFGLITNASENVVNPKKNVPKAIFISVFVVIVIYVLISLVAIGDLSVSSLVSAQENALAIAAMPFLGRFGFFLISIGALFSISSALNATVYGGANISYSLAKKGELPKLFERKIWFGGSEGLYITAFLSILFSLFFNLTDIASIISSIFTLIYISVIVSHLRLIKLVGGKKNLIIFNLVIISLVFLASLYYQIKTTRFAIYGTLIVLFSTIILEFLLSKNLLRKLNLRKFIGKL